MGQQQHSFTEHKAFLLLMAYIRAVFTISSKSKLYITF